MKNRIYRFLGAVQLLVLLGLTACNDNLLNVTPTDRVSDAAILSDPNLFEDYVLNRYLGTRLTEKEAEGTLPGFGRGFEYALWSSLTDAIREPSGENVTP